LGEFELSSILERLLSSGIIAVVRKIEPDKVEPLVKSLIDGGISGIEITIDSKDAFQKINELKKRFENDAVIGAGTVLNANQVKVAIDVGADFIFSPIVDKETIEYTKGRNKIMIPGVFSPTEVYQGYTWGADIVKVFPANTLGPQYIKDLDGPLANIPKMPTGGINLENITEYIRAGAVAAGVGGSLINKEMIADENWDGLRLLAEEYVLKVREARAAD
jgi:2-dehydro-3-deoxyphosphogluconate aldolase / (4S)-4-hydroxy-2-oxoglutarate aldolase